MWPLSRNKKQPAKRTKGPAKRPAGSRPRAASGGRAPVSTKAAREKEPEKVAVKGRRTGPDGAAREKGRQPEEARAPQPALPEVFEGPRTSQLTTLFALLIAAAAFVGVLAVLYLLFSMFTGGFGVSGSAPPPAEPASDKELATSLAENFSAAYLEMNAGEGNSRVEERLKPFLAPEALGAVPPKTSGEATRTVKDTSAYEARALRDGRWVVYTRSTVEVAEPGEDGEGGAGEDGAEGSTSQESSSSSSSSSDGSADATADAAADVSVKNVGLEVFVGVEDGEAAVDAAPNLIKPPSAFRGRYGAIYAEGAAPVEDEDLVSLLEGYFDALYGSAESQATLDRFFADDAVESGAARPALPDDALSYARLGEGWAYPVASGSGGASDGAFAETYDVEMTVHVADESLGLTAIQTHLLRVRRDGTSWTIVGTTPVVGAGSAPAATPAKGGDGGEGEG